MLAFSNGAAYLFLDHIATHNVDTTIADKQSWNILSLVNWGTEYLQKKEVESPRLTVELLLSRVLGCSRIELYTNFDKPLLPRDLAAFKQMFKRRVTHEPLQYILGDTEFMGLHFLVDRRVLIPRPETELLVEQVIKESAAPALQRILDIGTGSGNIAVSIAHYLSGVKVDAIDVSGEALAVAETNIRAHGLSDRVKLLLLDILRSDAELPTREYDLIVSNPPYVSREEFTHLAPEIRDHEPSIATTDEADGFTFFRRIATVAKRLLRVGGKIFLEVGYGQAGDVAEIFAKQGYEAVMTIPDYQGIERVLRITSAA